MEEPHARTGAIGGDVEAFGRGTSKGRSELSILPMNGFEWTVATCVSFACTWNELYLEAWRDGRWVVMRARNKMPLAVWEEQTVGTDLHDAEKRAQAAAMVIHQLAQEKHP